MSAEHKPDEQPTEADASEQAADAEPSEAQPRTLGQRLIDRILDADDGEGAEW